MSKKIDTWMPMYIGDYLSDTARLTTEQHGAYLLILMDYWRNGPPPDDATVLASIAKLNPQQWRKHADILRSFFNVQNGTWVQSRAESERRKALGVSTKRSDAGKEGAGKRWGKSHSKPMANDMANGMANGMANTSQSTSQSAWQNDAPSQSQETEKEKEPPPTAGVQGGKPSKPKREPNQKASKRCPADFVVTVELRAEASADSPGVDIDRETRKFRDWTFAKPHVDWPATWRNWMREASDRKRGNGAQQSFREIDAANAAEKVRQWTGGILDEKRDENRGEIFDLEAPNAPRIASR